MFKNTTVAAFGAPVALVIVWCTTLGAAQAQDVTLKDAIQCKDFKHAADGSWHAEDVSITYGGKSNQKQLNMFGSTTIRKGSPVSGVDLWTMLNEKCGAAK
jgi:hypothetical protein